MRCIMKTPDDQSMPGDEFLLRCQDCVVLFLQRERRITMAVECRLVRDDEIVTLLRSTLEHIERGHHGDCNSRHARGGITALERVDSVGTRLHWIFPANARNDFGGGDRLRL